MFELSLVYTLPWMVGSILLFVFGILWIIFYPLLRNLRNERRKRKILESQGRKTLAEIIEINETGITINKVRVYIKIRVRYELAEAEFASIVPIWSLPQIGQTIEIFFDPLDPTQIIPVKPL